MIAYNTQWLDALAVKAQSQKWHQQGLLTESQFHSVRESFVADFYTPNTFVRIGLGIFCFILVSSVFGLFGVALIDNLRSETASGVICLLFSTSLLAALEFFIRKKKYYQAGIDDALLYMAIGLAITGLCLLFSPLLDDHFILYCLLIFPVLVVAAIRYTDSVVTFCVFVCLVTIVFLLLKENTFTSKLLPLACMFLAAAMYYRIQKFKDKEHLRFWQNCFLVLEVCSLLLFYASGNKFVVEDVGEWLFRGFNIPYSFIFWVFTALTPLAYVYMGLKKRDRILLRVGLVIFGLSVITFKHYFSLGHHEVTLTLAGLALVSLAYLGIRYLKKGTSPFTYTEDKSGASVSLQNSEALLVAQSFGSPATPDKDFQFGGGKFGGGGAGGNY